MSFWRVLSVVKSFFSMPFILAVVVWHNEI
jgi:hypothetical protein